MGKRTKIIRVTPRGIRDDGNAMETLSDSVEFIFGKNTVVNFSGSTVSEMSDGAGGYEFTGGFEDRTAGTAGANDLGSNVQYTQEMVNNRRWLRFGFSNAQQLANDNPYWSNPTPEDAAGVGLFGGLHMPGGMTSLFDFGHVSAYNEAVTSGSFQYTSATGSLDYTQAKPGDFAQVRFDVNIVPQISNTTVEFALIWSTRDADDNITFTFPLTAQSVFFGNAVAAKSYLNRINISAYFASDEDVNARALPAIRADNPILIQPLTILNRISR